MGSKVCAIVGMGSGVGAAVARRFAAEGYCVAMISRDAGKLERYEHELAARGVTAQGFVVDAGSDESIVSAIENMRQAMPPPAPDAWDVAFATIVVRRIAGDEPRRHAKPPPSSRARFSSTTQSEKGGDAPSR